MMPSDRRPRVRVAAIIRHGATILLARHVKNGVSYWLLPGGGVEFGESLEEALIRELREEASVAIRVGALAFVNDTIAPDGERHIVNLAFHAEITGGEVLVGPDDRLVEVRFVPIEEVNAMPLRPDIREELLRGLSEGFVRGPAYLGKRWGRDDAWPR